MKPLAPGRVEHAIYTWSNRNPDGSKGEGIGACTPGLRGNLSGLSNFVAGNLYQFIAPGDEGQCKNFTFVGRSRFDGNGIGYRKTYDAGIDSEGRTRSLVHLMIGPFTEMTAFAVLEVPPRSWFSAEECPLNRLPDLGTLPPGRFPPLSPVNADVLAGECRDGGSACWDGHRDAVDELVQSGGVRVADASELSKLLALVPPSLRAFIDYDQLCGAPTLATLVWDRELWLTALAANEPQCAFDRAIAREIGGRPAGDYQLDEILARVVKPVPRTTAKAMPAKDQRSASGPPDTLTAILKDVLQNTTSEQDRTAALVQIVRQRVNVGRELLLLDADVVRAFTVQLHTREDYETLSSCFAAATPSELSQWVYRTGSRLAIYTLARFGEVDVERCRSNPYPVQGDEWRAVGPHLLATPSGVKFLQAIVSVGGLADAGLRRCLIDNAPAHGEAVFVHVVPSAPPEDIVEVLRDGFRVYAQWQQLPPVYANALEAGIRRRTARNILRVFMGGSRHS